MAGDLAWVQRLMAGGSASGVKIGLYPIVTFEKTATEYDGKPGIKRSSCAETWQSDMTLGEDEPGLAAERGRGGRLRRGPSVIIPPAFSFV